MAMDVKHESMTLHFIASNLKKAKLCFYFISFGQGTMITLKGHWNLIKNFFWNSTIGITE